MNEMTIASWIHAVDREARESRVGFASAHLPDIDSGATPPRSLNDVAELIEATLAAVSIVGASGVIRLAMRMTDTATMDTSLPDLAQWPFQDFEPPSLYYVHPRHLAVPADREEYRCAYDSDQLLRLRISAVYTCGRDLWARGQGWDFMRTIWFAPLVVSA